MIGREQAILSTPLCSEKPKWMYSQKYHLLNMKFLDQDIIDTFPQQQGQMSFWKQKSQ